MLKRLWRSVLWRFRKYLLPVIRKAGALIISPRTSIPYDFQRAQEYWGNVPRAKGGNPFDTVRLKSLTDQEVVTEFDREGEIARQKNERRLGYVLALETLGKLENPKVMDYGCGIGFYGMEILLQHPTACVTFVDINPENLAVVQRIANAKGFADRVDFVPVRDPEARDFDSPVLYDLIVSMGVLHHTPHAAQIVHNLSNFLKPGGIFQVMLYNYHYLKETQESAGRKLSFSGFGERTDPKVGDLSNPYSEPYDDEKAQQLFQGYSMVSADYPNPWYNTYRFRRG